ncbi:21579_t:CDS:1, partial [Dentiscutata erythropus]
PSTPFYSIVKVFCQEFFYYIVIWKKSSFITEDFHTINNLLPSFKDNNITLVCNSNLENTINEKFDEFAKHQISLDFWTNNENTIIDFFLKKSFTFTI